MAADTTRPSGVTSAAARRAAPTAARCETTRARCEESSAPLAGRRHGGGWRRRRARREGRAARGAVTQATAACAVSVCAVGGIVLLGPGLGVHPHTGAAPVRVAVAGSAAHAKRGSATGAAGASDAPATRPGSGRAAAAKVGGARAHTVVLQSRVSVGHPGVSARGHASSGGSSHGSGSSTSSSSPRQSGSSTGTSGPPNRRSTAGSSPAGPPTGAPAGAPEASGGPWSGSSAATSGSGSTDPWHSSRTQHGLGSAVVDLQREPRWQLGCSIRRLRTNLIAVSRQQLTELHVRSRAERALCVLSSTAARAGRAGTSRLE